MKGQNTLTRQIEKAGDPKKASNWHSREQLRYGSCLFASFENLFLAVVFETVTSYGLLLFQISLKTFSKFACVILPENFQATKDITVNAV